MPIKTIYISGKLVPGYFLSVFFVQITVISAWNHSCCNHILKMKTKMKRFGQGQREGEKRQAWKELHKWAWCCIPSCQNAPLLQCEFQSVGQWLCWLHLWSSPPLAIWIPTYSEQAEPKLGDGFPHCGSGQENPIPMLILAAALSPGLLQDRWPCIRVLPTCLKSVYPWGSIPHKAWGLEWDPVPEPPHPNACVLQEEEDEGVTLKI